MKRIQPGMTNLGIMRALTSEIKDTAQKREALDIILKISQDCEGYLKYFIQWDNLEIYDSRIIKFWNQCCKSNIKRFQAVMEYLEKNPPFTTNCGLQ